MSKPILMDDGILFGERGSLFLLPGGHIQLGEILGIVEPHVDADAIAGRVLDLIETASLTGTRTITREAIAQAVLPILRRPMFKGVI